MNLFNQISGIVGTLLSPEQLVKLLPAVLNLSSVLMSQGHDHLTPETIIFLQVEIEKLRNGL